MTTVERVTAATLGDWVAMRMALWPYATKQELEQGAVLLLSRTQPAAAFILRDEAGAALAFAEATLRVDYVNGCSTSPVAFLEGIYVRPEERRRGAARRLCRAVEAWARDQGCTEFASDADIGNTISHAMHAALGFVESERVVCYHKRLA
jgi:aminoglycoside 6'-N-acetyltransferase I